MTSIAMVEVEAAKLGFQLNKTKCEITSRVNRQENCSFHEAFGGFQFTDLDNLFMLGSPVTAGSTVDKALEEKTIELKTAISRLSTLQAHDALIILRISLSIPKLMYTLSTASCQGSARLIEFDNALN